MIYVGIRDPKFMGTYTSGSDRDYMRAWDDPEKGYVHNVGTYRRNGSIAIPDGTCKGWLQLSSDQVAKLEAIPAETMEECRQAHTPGARKYADIDELIVCLQPDGIINAYLLDGGAFVAEVAV